MVGIQQRAEDAAAEHRPWAWSGGAGRQHFTWSPQGVTPIPKMSLSLGNPLIPSRFSLAERRLLFYPEWAPREKQQPMRIRNVRGYLGHVPVPWLSLLLLPQQHDNERKEKMSFLAMGHSDPTYFKPFLLYLFYFFFSFLFFCTQFPFSFLTASILLDPTRVELLDLDKLKKKKLWVNLTLWFYQNILKKNLD